MENRCLGNRDSNRGQGGGTEEKRTRKLALEKREGVNDGGAREEQA